MSPSRLILLSYCEDVQAGPLFPSPPLGEESLGFEGLVKLLFLGSSTRTLSQCLELVGEVSGQRGGAGRLSHPRQPPQRVEARQREAWECGSGTKPACSGCEQAAKNVVPLVPRCPSAPCPGQSGRASVEGENKQAQDSPRPPRSQLGLQLSFPESPLLPGYSKSPPRISSPDSVVCFLERGGRSTEGKKGR